MMFSASFFLLLMMTGAAYIQATEISRCHSTKEQRKSVVDKMLDVLQCDNYICGRYIMHMATTYIKMSSIYQATVGQALGYILQLCTECGQVWMLVTQHIPVPRFWVVNWLPHLVIIGFSPPMDQLQKYSVICHFFHVNLVSMKWEVLVKVSQFLHQL